MTGLSWRAGSEVAQVCHLNGTPFLIVRTTSGSAVENSVKEFKQRLTETAADAAKVVGGVPERVRR